MGLSDNYNTVNGGKPLRKLKKAKGIKSTKAENCPSDVISFADLETVLGSVVISNPSLNAQSDGDVEILSLWCTMSVLSATAACGRAGTCVKGCLLGFLTLPLLGTTCLSECNDIAVPECTL